MPRYRLVIMGLVGSLTLASVAESQIFAYWTSSLRYATSSPARQDHAPEIVLSHAAENGRNYLTVLAAGDIARCPRQDFAGRYWPSLSYSLGLPVETDTQDPEARKTARLAARWPDAVILGLGDLVYNRGTSAEFATCFEPLWGGLAARMLPTPGNHEYKSQAAFGYYDYWGVQAGPDRRGYYSTRWRNWLILSLNSEVDAAPDSAQARWLAGTLSAAPEECILAFYHKPAHSLKVRRAAESAMFLFRQLQRAGATVVLNGHNHFYERTRPLDAEGAISDADGTISITAGTGGEVRSPLDPVTETASAIFDHPGLLRLELRANGFAWWFHEAENARVLDEGEAPCNRRETDLSARNSHRIDNGD